MKSKSSNLAFVNERFRINGDASDINYRAATNPLVTFHLLENELIPVEVINESLKSDGANERS